jgi:hypothetical protein
MPVALPKDATLAGRGAVLCSSLMRTGPLELELRCV